MNVYFTDFFEVNEDDLQSYGAFNISLINDLPLFVDPFLLFGSKKEKYKDLHAEILDYLIFLKERADRGDITISQIQSWYLFPEVKQNWLGYSKIGNNGSGLGPKFGTSLSVAMPIVFDDLGKEQLTQTSHLEKAGLFEIGVGRDNISDFTTNLIKEYLLEYTQEFTLQHIKEDFRQMVNVDKVFFDYELERWMPKEFILPYRFNDYVILTPKDLLTKDENWINSQDMLNKYVEISNSIPNGQLRNEVDNYFRKQLPVRNGQKRATNKERRLAFKATIEEFPWLIKYYIKLKEENKNAAKSVAEQKVSFTEEIYIRQLGKLIKKLKENTKFYDQNDLNSYSQSLERANYLKHVIEDMDGWRLFYGNGQPIKKESDLQIVYRLTWFASELDVNREPNNGRGPVDYAVSSGARNKTLVEFKLASNSKLEQNLKNQVDVYKIANSTDKAIKVIMYYNAKEFNKVQRILDKLKITGEESIVLIDASPKISASNVK